MGLPMGYSSSCLLLWNLKIDSPLCFFLLKLFISITVHFGIPLSSEKTIMPSTSLDFLDITIGTLAMESRFPAVKTFNFHHVSEVKHFAYGTLIPTGPLSFCFHSYAGRSNIFSNSWAKTPSSHIRLSREDLSMWFQFFDQYNGRYNFKTILSSLWT